MVVTGGKKGSFGSQSLHWPTSDTDNKDNHVDYLSIKCTENLDLS